jgi:hypothetical protein
MTGAACGIFFPAELSGAFRLDDVSLVAGDAVNRDVRARKGILALPMALDSIENTPEVIVDMARLAFPTVGPCRELSTVGIFVAVPAAVEL